MAESLLLNSLLSIQSRKYSSNFPFFGSKFHSEVSAPGGGGIIGLKYLSIEIESGTAPFTFDWSNDLLEGQSVADLIAGEYAVTVTDASGCVDTENIEILGFQQPLLSEGDLIITPADCREPDSLGSIEHISGLQLYNFGNIESLTDLAEGTQTFNIPKIV